MHDFSIIHIFSFQTRTKTNIFFDFWDFCDFWDFWDSYSEMNECMTSRGHAFIHLWIWIPKIPKITKIPKIKKNISLSSSLKRKDVNYWEVMHSTLNKNPAERPSFLIIEFHYAILSIHISEKLFQFFWHAFWIKNFYAWIFVIWLLLFHINKKNCKYFQNSFQVLQMF